MALHNQMPGKKLSVKFIIFIGLPVLAIILSLALGWVSVYSGSDASYVGDVPIFSLTGIGFNSPVFKAATSDQNSAVKAAITSAFGIDAGKANAVDINNIIMLSDISILMYLIPLLYLIYVILILKKPSKMVSYGYKFSLAVLILSILFLIIVLPSNQNTNIMLYASGAPLVTLILSGVHWVMCIFEKARIA
ncbi:MAG: hypothetical protein Q8865_01735 [Bacillota bacterium]|nr:hypothetical protein [Bacillota bacterium]